MYATTSLEVPNYENYFQYIILITARFLIVDSCSRGPLPAISLGVSVFRDSFSPHKGAVEWSPLWKIMLWMILGFSSFFLKTSLLIIFLIFVFIWTWQLNQIGPFVVKLKNLAKIFKLIHPFWFLDLKLFLNVEFRSVHSSTISTMSCATYPWIFFLNSKFFFNSKFFSKYNFF